MIELLSPAGQTALAALDRLCADYSFNWEFGIKHVEQWEFVPVRYDRCITLFRCLAPLGILEINDDGTFSGGLIGYAGIHKGLTIGQVEYMILVVGYSGGSNG